jgi:outer membrane protein TolC
MKPFTVFLTINAFLIMSCSSFYTGGLKDDTGSSLAASPRLQHGSGPLSTSALAELAVENSLELKVERNNLDARVGAWRLGLRGFLPQIEVSAGSDERLSLYSADSFSKNLSVSITQPVWDGGRLVTARSLESAAIALAGAELERKTTDIGEEAVAAARAVLSAGARLDIKKKSRESASSQHAILMTEMDLGLAMTADLLEVEKSLAEMDLELAEEELELSIARAELADILCVDLLPELSEQFTRHKLALYFDPELVGPLAVRRSPELAMARYSLVKKRAECKASKFSWLPTIGLKVSGLVSGSEYPLTRATWSAGLTMDFSSPCLNSSGSTQLGSEPPDSYTARINNRLEILPDPARLPSLRQAEMALDLEYEAYSIQSAQVERSAKVAMVVYENALRIRDIGIRSLELAESRLSLLELKVGLGQAMRVDLIKAELERATVEVELVDAVAELVAAERGLERLFDIPPGTLAAFFTAVEGVQP